MWQSIKENQSVLKIKSPYYDTHMKGEEDVLKLGIVYYSTIHQFPTIGVA